MASKVSDEKCADNSIEDHLYVMIFFSLAVFKILSLSSFFGSVIMGLSVGLFEFILEFVQLLGLYSYLASNSRSF